MPTTQPPRRILLYRLGSLGDMLIALPSLHLVARAFPGAERRLLTNVPVSSKAPAAAAILGPMEGSADGRPLVEEYVRYTVGTRNPLDLLKLWWQIRRFRPEALVYLAASRGTAAAERDAKFFRLCGIRRLIGVPLTEAMQQNFYGASAGDPLALNLEPEAARLARNLAELGDGRLDELASWDLQLTVDEKAAALAAIQAQVPAFDGSVRSAVAVSVGTKVQAKDWGRENWRALLGAFAAEFPGRTLLLAGAPEESEASEFAAEGWRAAGGGPVVNLCGKLSPRQSAAAFAHAYLFLGHDSGPMHLAAAVGTPCVALFAARNIPRQWFPVGQGHRVLYHPVDCMGCGLETCIEQKKKCLLSITVPEVMEQVRLAQPVA
ncbi:MAG: glycosyltransferase family 9 protein [Acidobacteriaceae bacterium]|nr:glycosyltransferase family 9 protein [Acidobacteriaceae bacterium]